MFFVLLDKSSYLYLYNQVFWPCEEALKQKIETNFLKLCIIMLCQFGELNSNVFGSKL